MNERARRRGGAPGRCRAQAWAEKGRFRLPSVNDATQAERRHALSPPRRRNTRAARGRTEVLATPPRAAAKTHRDGRRYPVEEVGSRKTPPARTSAVRIADAEEDDQPRPEGCVDTPPSRRKVRSCRTRRNLPERRGTTRRLRPLTSGRGPFPSAAISRRPGLEVTAPREGLPLLDGRRARLSKRSTEKIRGGSKKKKNPHEREPPQPFRGVRGARAPD
jgi:hypothetical protein